MLLQIAATKVWNPLILSFKHHIATNRLWNGKGRGAGEGREEKREKPCECEGQRAATRIQRQGGQVLRKVAMATNVRGQRMRRCQDPLHSEAEFLFVYSVALRELHKARELLRDRPGSERKEGRRK